jgi:hypothetical protein
MKAAGVSYEKIVYIGGYAGTSTGLRYYFYVLTHKGIVGPNQTSEDYFAFTVAPDGGGIVRIE